MIRHRASIAVMAASLLLVAAACVPPTPELPDPVITCDSFDASATYDPPPTTAAGDSTATLTAGSGLSECTDSTDHGITGATMTGQIAVEDVCTFHPDGTTWGTGSGTITWSNGWESQWAGEVVQEGTTTLRLELTGGKWRGSTAVVAMQSVGGSGDCNAGLTEQSFTNAVLFVLHPPGAVARPPLKGAEQVVAGGGHGCAVMSDETMQCWGFNSRGQLGNGSVSPFLGRQQPYATPVVGLTGVTAASAGDRHTCAVADGEVRCWGANEAGQLGDGTLEDRSAPTATGLSGVVDVAAGSDTTCALLSDGTVQCWGGYDTEPTPVSGITGATELAVGGYLQIYGYGKHACAVVGGGAVKCWGENSRGELGDGTNVDSATPVDVVGVSGASAITAGLFSTSCATAGGQVKCWGRNDFGQLGDGTTADSNVPVVASGVTGAVDVGAGGVHTCARLGDGSVRCWGSNSYGQVGDGTTTQRLTPVAVAGLGAPASDLAVGHYSTCAVVGGKVKCWGSNGGGALGNGTLAAQSTAPTDVVSSP